MTPLVLRNGMLGVGVLVALLAPTRLTAQRSSLTNDDAARFADASIRALELFADAVALHKPWDDRKDRITNSLDQMTSYRLIAARLKESVSELGPFLDSRVEIIAPAALTQASAYSALSGAHGPVTWSRPPLRGIKPPISG